MKTLLVKIDDEGFVTSESLGLNKVEIIGLCELIRAKTIVSFGKTSIEETKIPKVNCDDNL